MGAGLPARVVISAESLLQSAVALLHAVHTHFPTDFRIFERISYLGIRKRIPFPKFRRPIMKLMEDSNSLLPAPICLACGPKYLDVKTQANLYGNDW